MTWNAALRRAELGSGSHATAQAIVINAKLELIKTGCRTAVLVSVFALDNAVQLSLSGQLWEMWLYVASMVAFAAAVVFGVQHLVLAVSCFFTRCCCS